jgi:hypothetical protein
MASLQHVERLVLALVDMRRGAGPLGCRHLHRPNKPPVWVPEAFTR